MPPPEVNRELDRRERGRAVPPDPAAIFTPAELGRLEHVRRVRALSTYWHINPTETKRRLFIRALIAAGRIGKGDR